MEIEKKEEIMPSKKCKPIVLLLEDLPDHAESLTNVLRDFMEIKSVINGRDVELLKKEFLTKVKITKWQLVGDDGEKKKIQEELDVAFFIFDLRMPGSSGTENWIKLGKPEKYAFYTVWSDDPISQEQMRNAGVQDCRVVSKRADNVLDIAESIKKIMKKDKIL